MPQGIKDGGGRDAGGRLSIGEDVSVICSDETDCSEDLKPIVGLIQMPRKREMFIFARTKSPIIFVKHVLLSLT